MEITKLFLVGVIVILISCLAFMCWFANGKTMELRAINNSLGNIIVGSESNAVKELNNIIYDVAFSDSHYWETRVDEEESVKVGYISRLGKKTYYVGNNKKMLWWDIPQEVLRERFNVKW